MTLYENNHKTIKKSLNRPCPHKSMCLMSLSFTYSGSFKCVACALGTSSCFSDVKFVEACAGMSVD